MKHFYLIIAFLFITTFANAQYCGDSGPSVCTPVSDTAAQPGIRPHYLDLAPLVNGVTDEVILQFKNFTTFTFSGQTITVQSLKFDSILKLPPDVCWATNKPNNTSSTGEEGCIRFSGNLCGEPGQYRLRIVVTADVGIPGFGSADGLKYFVRLKNAGDPDTPVDTTQTAQTPFISYGSFPVGCISSVGEIEPYSVTVFPNPSTSRFTIQMHSVHENALLNLYNTYGSLVKQQPIASTNTTIHRDDFPNGIYFWQVSSNEKVVGRGKLILE